MFMERDDENMVDESCQIGRKILSNTNYRLLSTRLIYPESFEFHPSTLEAKKAILMNMSPMLKEAEEQKKKDSLSCETFTRCKGSRGRGAYSIYEYVDIDTQLRVDYSEYEKRSYLLILTVFLYK